MYAMYGNRSKTKLKQKKKEFCFAEQVSYAQQGIKAAHTARAFFLV